MYVSFTEYQQMGGTAQEAAFPRLEYRAEKLIDRYTQKRVQGMPQVPEAVKRCLTELVNAMVISDPTTVAAGPALSGFSNDGYSESYAVPVTEESLAQAFSAIIRDYLCTETDHTGTPLLYRGVDV